MPLLQRFLRTFPLVSLAQQRVSPDVALSKRRKNAGAAIDALTEIDSQITLAMGQARSRSSRVLFSHRARCCFPTPRLRALCVVFPTPRSHDDQPPAQWRTPRITLGSRCNINVACVCVSSLLYVSARP